MPSRRTFLTVSGAALTASTAGCLGLFGAPAGKRFTETTAASPFIADGPTPSEGPPFAAAVVTSRDEAERRLDYDALPESIGEEYRGTDFSSSFVAVFVTRRRLTPAGTSKGDCPLGDYDGDSFAFRLRLQRWPPVRDDGTLGVHLERWRLEGNRPPKRARVEVSLVDDALEDACSD